VNRVPLLIALLAIPALADPWNVEPAALKGVVNPVPAARRAASVARGQALYAKECASCHGDTGKGDGPDGLYFTTRPSDLTAPSVKQQSDAVLFVKLTTGRGDMKAYEKVYDAAQRWDLVNAVRALK
jgi:mono/diheme cytochrome c family protein